METEEESDKIPLGYDPGTEGIHRKQRDSSKKLLVNNATPPSSRRIGRPGWSRANSAPEESRWRIAMLTRRAEEYSSRFEGGNDKYISKYKRVLWFLINFESSIMFIQVLPC
ncbi:hypothetical protein LINGRAPRIM_LOCUS3282 [Linum grandiflorum]